VVVLANAVLWWRRMPFVGLVDAKVRASGGNYYVRKYDKQMQLVGVYTL